MFFKPMSRQPMYLDPRWPELTAHRYAETGLYLPTHTGLSTADQDAIIDAVRSFPHEG